MKKVLWVTVVILMMNPAVVMSKQSDTGKQGEQGINEQQMKRPVVLECGYLLYLPKEYEQGEKKWPLMLFLHGAGERGNDLKMVKRHGPLKEVEKGKEFPFIIAAPQCPKDRVWSSETLITLLDELCEKYSVDEKRVYLTGLSMGGFGTWYLACDYPERFAAIVPICGGGLSFRAHRLREIPAWAFHGEKDPVVPAAMSRQMVDAVNAAGGTARLRVYPEAGHDSWTQTYANPELYEWLLRQKKDLTTK